jgi:hypothetical protein
VNIIFKKYCIFIIIQQNRRNQNKVFGRMLLKETMKLQTGFIWLRIGVGGEETCGKTFGSITRKFWTGRMN